ncbi:MAG: hypothetical protein RQ739_04395 [Desulfotignum sp.]|nr:hypothetical protein [Desulfotignum sp.]
MNLTQKIKEKKSEFQSSAPDEIQEVMGRAIKQLQHSKMMGQVLKKGDKAPDFTLENTSGDYINLNDTLSSGPVVAGFYRGRW